MHDDSTVIGSWVVAIARALGAYGCDSQKIFAEAGIDLDATCDPDVRFPIGNMNQVWKLAVKATKDPGFGLTVAEFVLPTTFHALGYSMWASSTLRSAFLRLVRYYRLVADAAELTLEETDADSRLVGHVLYPGLAYEAQDAGAACIIKVCRVLYKPDLNPVSIALTRPEPKNSEKFQQYFNAPVRFSANALALVFRKEDLNAPLPGSNPELAQYSDQVAAECLARLDKDRIVTQVYAKLIEQLPSGEPTEEKIAQSLHMSLRSLQRRLSEEDTSYRGILDRTREELASEYLKQRHLSLSEIAFMVGFSDSSNFSRAFKRWTGLAPSNYRAALTDPNVLAGHRPTQDLNKGMH
jgi:AraC-like DNA-binding protein